MNCHNCEWFLVHRNCYPCNTNRRLREKEEELK